MEGATLFALGKNELYTPDVTTGAVQWQYNLARYPAEDCLFELLGTTSFHGSLHRHCVQLLLRRQVTGGDRLVIRAVGGCIGRPLGVNE